MNRKKYFDEIKYVKNIVYDYILDKINLNNAQFCIKNYMNFKNEIKTNINTKKIKQLYNNYEYITSKKGLYFIVTTDKIQVNEILNNVKLKNGETYKGKLYKKDFLIEKYNNIKDNKYSNILYIGKAQCKYGLKERITKYINFGYGKCKNHAGGRAIWQLKNSCELYIVWLESDNIKDNFIHKMESYLIKNYNQDNTNNSKCSINYPFANWRT